MQKSSIIDIINIIIIITTSQLAHRHWRIWTPILAVYSHLLRVN